MAIMISRLVMFLKSTEKSGRIGSEEVELIGLGTPLYMVVNWEV